MELKLLVVALALTCVQLVSSQTEGDMDFDAIFNNAYDARSPSDPTSRHYGGYWGGGGGGGGHYRPRPRPRPRPGGYHWWERPPPPPRPRPDSSDEDDYLPWWLRPRPRPRPRPSTTSTTTTTTTTTTTPATPAACTDTGCDFYKALCQMDMNGVKGEFRFVQPKSPAAGAEISVTFNYAVEGILPGKHGLHIHSKNLATESAVSCEDVGDHFNPQNQQHGGPTASNRHAGDLGNIDVGPDRTAAGSQVNNLLRLLPGKDLTSIVDHALVITEEADDLGLQQNALSSVNGNSGPSLACCVIHAVYQPNEEQWYTPLVIP